MSEADKIAAEDAKHLRNAEYVRDAHNAMTCTCSQPIRDRTYGGEWICKCGKFIRERMRRGV